MPSMMVLEEAVNVIGVSLIIVVVRGNGALNTCCGGADGCA